MTNHSKISNALATQFASIVGAKNALAGADMSPHLIEWRDKYQGSARMVLRPGSTDEISAILKLANDNGVGIVPQGGNTGLVGAQIPFDANQIVVSLGRMNTIRSVDPDANSLVCDAGTVLANIQQAADEVDRLFPLSLGAEGSCQIGGNLSTNAGGTGVLAYGNARELVLGLEVVLANGDVWNGLKTLRKDNTGYDLKHLFLGAEGTLGIITAVSLKLFAKPRATEVAFAGLRSPEDAVALFRTLIDAEGRNLTGCEIMPRVGIEFVLRHGENIRDPLREVHDWYLLLEFSSSDESNILKSRVQILLANALESGLISDVALAESGRQAEDFWRLRTVMSEVQKLEGGSIKHDISVPVSAIPEFLTKAAIAVEKIVPGVRPVPFGHLGDGNIHYNVSQPVGVDRDEYLARWEAMNNAVHDIVVSLDGSISAEHGIGVLKRDLLPRYKSEVEMRMMRNLKAMLDPNNVLNPGKML